MNDQVSQIYWWKTIYRFENMQKNLEFQAIIDRQPIELNEDMSDMIIFVGARKSSSSSILNSLQAKNCVNWQAIV